MDRFGSSDLGSKAALKEISVGVVGFLLSPIPAPLNPNLIIFLLVVPITLLALVGWARFHVRLGGVTQGDAVGRV